MGRPLGSPSSLCVHLIALKLHLVQITLYGSRSCVWFLYFGLFPRIRSQKWDYEGSIHTVKLLSKRTLPTYGTHARIQYYLKQEKFIKCDDQKVLLYCLKHCFFNCLQHKVVLTHFLGNSCFGPLYLLDFDLFFPFKKRFILLCICLNVCALHVCTACRGQKRMLDTL